MNIKTVIKIIISNIVKDINSSLILKIIFFTILGINLKYTSLNLLININSIWKKKILV